MQHCRKITQCCIIGVIIKFSVFSVSATSSSSSSSLFRGVIQSPSSLSSSISSLSQSSYWILPYCVILCLCCVLITPPLHKTSASILSFVANSSWSSSVVRSLQAILIVFILCFMVSLSSFLLVFANNSVTVTATVDNIHAIASFNIVLAQGACLLLAILIYRVCELMLCERRLESRLIRQRQESSHMKAAYSLLLVEKNDLEQAITTRGANKAKRLSISSDNVEMIDKDELLRSMDNSSSSNMDTVIINSASSSSLSLDSLHSTLNECESKLVVCEKEKRVAEHQVKIARKRNDALQYEFARLNKHNETLRNQLAEYEIMMSGGGGSNNTHEAIQTLYDDERKKNT